MDASLKARLRGRKAKVNGEAFELQLKAQAMQSHATLTKIPSGAKFLGKNKIIAVKSPFDFLLTHKGSAAYFDAKSTEEKTFNYAKIKQHQISELFLIEEQEFPAGYLVNFTTLKKMSFFPASLLKEVRPRQSLLPEDGFIIRHLLELLL